MDEQTSASSTSRASVALGASILLALVGFPALFVGIWMLAGPAWALVASGVAALWFSYVAAERHE